MAHRDLKPENILCEGADKVSLLPARLAQFVQRAANAVIKHELFLDMIWYRPYRC